MYSNKQINISAYIALGKILSMLIGFVTPLFLTRYLTKEDYGLYAQFYTVFLFAGNILGMGVQSNLYFFYSDAEQKNRQIIVSNTYFLLLIFATLGVFILATKPLSTLFLGKGELQNYTYFVLLSIWFFIPTKILEPLYTLRRDRITSTLYPPIEIIGKVVFVIGSALIFKTISSIFMAICLFLFFCFIFSFIYASRSGFRLLKVALLSNISKEQLKYAIPFGLSTIIITIASRLDKILSINYLSLEDYAIYSLAFFGIPGVMQIYDSLCQVNVMNMAKEYHNKNIDKVLDLYKVFVVKTLSFSLPIILIVFLFSKQIVLFLFTEKYIESVPFFRIYILTFIIGMLGAGTILRAIGKTKLTLKANIIASLFFIPFTYFMVRNYGVWGAMSGALAGNLLPRIIQIIQEIKIIKCGIRFYFPIEKIGIIFLISVLSIFPFVALNLFFSISFWVSILLSGLYIIISYYFLYKYNVFLLTNNSFMLFLSKIPRLKTNKIK